MEPMLEELDNLIKGRRPELHEALLPGVSSDQFSQVQNIPPMLKRIWLWHNGQSQSFHGDFHSKTNEMLMSLESAIETKNDFSELVECGDISSDNWKEEWLPFTENGGGNYMCVSLKTGEVFYYDKYETSTSKMFLSVENWLEDLIEGYRKL